MSKHTPGPWTVHHIMRDCVTFEGKHGTENLFIQNLDGYFACQNKYDARLIAAAPELLEALKLSRLAFEAMIEDGRCGETFVAVALTLDIINAAIAKAEGKQ